MGVEGFFTFLKINDHMMADKIQLSDTTIVIDADNLACELFSQSCLNEKSEHFRNDIYGGDLVAYGLAVREFFGSLKKCNITAILVFDGSVLERLNGIDGIEFAESKEKEIHLRSLEKFACAKALREFGNNGEGVLLLPQAINIETIFRNIATELGVQRIQAPYEAGSHIARVANERDCSVLSNDSDLFILRLERGYLLLDFFNYKKPIVLDEATGKESKINCTLYSQDKLIRILPGLTWDCMPLLLMLGNDYVDVSAVFDKITHNIVQPHYDSPLETGNFKREKLANLLEWMRGKTLEQCRNFVLKSFEQVNQRPKIYELLVFFSRIYHIETEDNLDDMLEQIYPSNDGVDASLRETPGTFLRRHLEHSDLSAVVLEMIFHKAYFSQTSPDDFTLPSCNELKFRPLRLAHLLLRPKSYDEKRTHQTEKDSLRVFDRVRGEYSEITLKPMEELENFGTLNHIDCYSMITLEPALKSSMLMACFRFTQEELSSLNDIVSRILTGPLVAEASLCFALVKYIGAETGMAPRQEFVSALMVTFFYHAAIGGNLNMDCKPHGDELTLLQFLKRLALTNNGEAAISPHDQQLYQQIVHLISQLQTAYKAFFLVNALLDHVLLPPRLERFFNSTLVFRLTRLLWLKEETIEDICQELTHLADACESLQTILHCCPGELVVSESCAWGYS